MNKKHSALPAIFAMATLTLTGCIQMSAPEEEPYGTVTQAESWEDDAYEPTFPIETIDPEHVEDAIGEGFDPRRPYGGSTANEMVELDHVVDEGLAPEAYEPGAPLEMVELDHVVDEGVAPEAYEPSFPIETIELDHVESGTYDANDPVDCLDPEMVQPQRLEGRSLWAPHSYVGFRGELIELDRVKTRSSQ